MQTEIQDARYERLQELGRELTQEVALAEMREDWKRVDELIREKDRINRQLREAQCRQT